MKKFKINIFTRWAMKKERDRLIRSGEAKFNPAIEPERESYWIATNNLPPPDAPLSGTLDPYAAKLAGVQK